jgi:hypothetical protein
MDSKTITIFFSNKHGISDAAQSLQDGSFSFQPFIMNDMMNFTKEPYASLSSSDLGLQLLDILRTFYEGSRSIRSMFEEDLAAADLPETTREHELADIKRHYGDRRVVNAELLKFISTEDFATFLAVLEMAILDSAEKNIDFRDIARNLYMDNSERALSKLQSFYGPFVESLLMDGMIASVKLTHNVSVPLCVSLTGSDTFEKKWKKLCDTVWTEIF